MTKDRRYKHFINYFSKNYQSPTTELVYKNPFELLVAVILSARCTDKRVNLITPKLFECFPTPTDMANASFDVLFPYIKSITFPNNKTKYLIDMANKIVHEFNSKVPNNVEDLQKLSGVGRKTAHVIVSVLHNMPKMVVDTHVERVSKRIGLVDKSKKTPLEIEKELVNYVPNKYIHKFHHWLILHGKTICIARKPKCDSCPIDSFCLYYEKNY